MTTVAGTLKGWAGRSVVSDRRATAAIGVAAFVLATSFGAYVAVPLPLTPVPMTLQPLFVILAGVALGPRLGAAAMAAYLAMGAAGAPVFSGGHAGLPWLMGPTGGYLVAMPAAAFVAGAVAGASRRSRLLAGLALGIVTLYVGGLSQLFILTRGEPGGLLALGVLPFLFGDVVKVLIAFLLAGPIRSSSLGR